MRTSSFWAFVAPSLLMMLVFIAFPLFTVAYDSVHSTQRIYREEVREQCSPGFPAPVCTQQKRLLPQMGADGTPMMQTRFAGWQNYSSLLQPDTVKAALSKGWAGLHDLGNIKFYAALRFTLLFTFLTLPCILILGLLLALALNMLTRRLRGPVIFVTLLPFIVTPVIGALSIRWLFVGDGIMTSAITALTGSHFSTFAQAWSIEALIIGFRIWHTTPFAFIIFYAGLQTINQETLDAALVDGASRLQRLVYVVLPHLLPLVIFVTLVHLMDAYRVFDEIIGFASEAYVISLQWLTYDLLQPDTSGNRAIGRASASSMLTLLGIVVILIPLIRQTWRDQRGQVR